MGAHESVGDRQTEADIHNDTCASRACVRAYIEIAVRPGQVVIRSHRQRHGRGGFALLLSHARMHPLLRARDAGRGQKPDPYARTIRAARAPDRLEAGRNTYSWSAGTVTCLRGLASGRRSAWACVGAVPWRSRPPLIRSAACRPALRFHGLGGDSGGR